jgi:monofunctional biosynthetic peptidoglycan transglycosylase
VRTTRATEKPLEAEEPQQTHEDRPRHRRRNVLLVLLGASAVLGLGLWYLVVPYPWTLGRRNPERTSLMEQRIREARRQGAELDIRQEWVPLSDIAPELRRAVVVAEDYRFREHQGIDWVSLAEEVHWSGDDDFSWWSASDLRALAGALGYAWEHRADMRGRSTITQQLAKNLYFGTDRSFVRKAMEFVVARRLERRLDKDRILELYLNIAEWGPGVFGAEAAARTYFGKPASALTLSEAAALAGTLPHPLTSNPALNPRQMRWRQNLILDRLDPSRGLPPPPGPLPDLEIDLVVPEIPALELPAPTLSPPDTPSVTPADTV